MTFFNGSVSVLRIKTAPTSLSHIDVVRKLFAHRVTPIGLDDVKERSVGWCKPFNGDADFTVADCAFDGVRQVVLSLRIDEKKIPGSTLRIQIKQAMEQLSGGNPSDGMASMSTGGKRIPKKIRDAVRDRVRNELLKSCCPNTKLFCVLWDTNSGELWIESTAKSTYEAFERLFIETFNLPLLEVNPGTLPTDGLTGHDDLERLFPLVPATFINHDEVSNA